MQTPPRLRTLGFVLGVFAFVAILLLPAPEGLGAQGMAVLACAALLALWWMTEALPIPVTSLLPIVLFPLLGVMSIQDASAPYADSLVFLFLGGFILALGIERSRAHKRIALLVLRIMGEKPSRIVLGFMLATAGLSLWISNTATVMLMLPIALAVLERTEGGTARGTQGNFAMALLLGIAYAASIGGVGTLIGTPPNIVLAGVMGKLHPELPPIGFVQWMLFGIPLVVLFLPLCWLLLVRVLPFTRLHGVSAIGAVSSLDEELRALGPVSRVERRVLLLFLATALGWIFRVPIEIGTLRIPGLIDVLPQLTDAGIAMSAAVALFLLPTGSGTPLLQWQDVQKGVPWGILLLFGGGFALAEAMRRSGVTLYLGGWIHSMDGVPVLLVIASVCLLLTFLTELTSNTATASILVPVTAGAAVALGQHPLLLALPAALSASFAFMLPVATPPNAIVFSTGQVGIRHMAITGFALNLIGVVLVTALMYALGQYVFAFVIR